MTSTWWELAASNVQRRSLLYQLTLGVNNIYLLGKTTKELQNIRYILPVQVEWTLAKEIVISSHNPITAHLLIPWTTQVLSFLAFWVIDYYRRMTDSNIGLLHGTWPGDCSLIHLGSSCTTYLYVAQMPRTSPSSFEIYSEHTVLIVIRSDLHVSKLRWCFIKLLNALIF